MSDDKHPATADATPHAGDGSRGDGARGDGARRDGARRDGARGDGARGDSGGRFDRRLIPPMILGSVLNPINSTIIAVALVPIGVAFGAPPSETAWLVSALYFATALGQPVVGRLIDLFGSRRLFLIGAALVGIAGVIGM